MSFNPHFSWDFLATDEIAERSMRAFRNHLKFLKQDSKYYQEILKDINPDKVLSYEDIRKLPLTEKKTLSDNLPDFLVAPEDSVVETVVTSGSTGSPLIVPLTQSDIERLAYNESLSFHSAGVSSSDRAFIMVSMDRLFIAGMAYYQGLTALGVNTSRIGVLAVEMQKHYMELLKPTVLVGVPSYLLKLGNYLKKEGATGAISSVSKIFCIGEPIREEDMSPNSIATDLKKCFSAELFSTYASTEVSSTFCDCTAGAGAHSHPELVYAEILDDSGNPVEDGVAGELVVTPFGIEGLPLLRYRTGDITTRVEGKCSCGRNSMRVGPILSRKSQLLKVKGTTIYPLTIINCIDSIDAVDDFIIELKGKEGTPNEEIFIHAVTKPNQVGVIMSQVQAAARVSIPVLVTNQPTLNSYRGDSRKKIRIVDNRN
jgi:phenylacetate-CoA ligase